MNNRARQAESDGDTPPVSSGLVLINAGMLVPVQLPFSDELIDPRQVPASKIPAPLEGMTRREIEYARAAVGHNLRWAFPLPNGGSFNQLLAALEEA